MGWCRMLVDFWKSNMERNVKRISVAIGAFLVYGLVTIPIGSIWKGAVITLGSIIVMSIFGKNGNGQTEKEKEEDPVQVEKSRETRIKEIKSELVLLGEK